MTEQEKISEIIWYYTSNLSPDGVNTIAKEIIKAFPQITKKSVKIDINDVDELIPGVTEDEYVVMLADYYFPSKEIRKAWIDSHFVEVV